MAADPDKPAEPEKDKGPLPAWSLRAGEADRIRLQMRWPEEVTREWAWGGADGEGVRVCILDSGIEAEHPLVNGLAGAKVVSLDDEGEVVVADDTEGDVVGHGTACAGIIRMLAPKAQSRVTCSGQSTPIEMRSPAPAGRLQAGRSAASLTA